MKIIKVSPQDICNNSAASTFNSVNNCERISIVADSALLTHGKPMFVPQWGIKCIGQWCIAARISRLGKTIPQRFAWERYCDSMSIAVKFEQKLPHSSSDVTTNFDGAVCCGEFEGLPTDNAPLTIELQVGKDATSITLSDYADVVGEAIHTASVFMSVRQGDILLTPIDRDMCHSFAATPNTHIAGTIGGRKVIEFNIK